MGISGDTTSGGRARMQPALSVMSSVVILELGANDGLRGQPVAQMQANLEEMIGGFQKAGAKVVLAGMTLPRNYGSAYVGSFEDVFRNQIGRASCRERVECWVRAAAVTS